MAAKFSMCGRRTKRFFVWWLVAIHALASLYILSWVNIFRLESQSQQQKIPINSDHAIPSDNSISTNDIEHRKRFLDFTRTQKQQKQHYLLNVGNIPNSKNEDNPPKFLKYPRTNEIRDKIQVRNGGENVSIINADEKSNTASEREALPSKQRSRSNANINSDSGTSQQQEKIMFKLERIAQKLGHAPGWNNDRNTDKSYLPLWELSEIVPPWMKDYFAWHQEKRRTLAEDMWHQWKNNETDSRGSIEVNGNGPKLLVVQCMKQTQSKATLRGSSKNKSLASALLSPSPCGTLSERLSALPYWLRIAHDTNRLLFIHWTVPADLLAYMDPPVGGCDWRVPIWLKEMLQDDQQGVLINDESNILSDGSYLHDLDSELLLRVQLKHSSNFEDRYNALRNSNESKEEPAFHQVFHDVWNIFFTPSLALRKNLYHVFRTNSGMKAGCYTSIDFSSARTAMLSLSPLPSQQNEDDRDSDYILKTKLGFECASSLQSNGAFWVVSDVVNITRTFQDHYGAEEKNCQSGKCLYTWYKELTSFQKKKSVKDNKEPRSQKLIDFDAANLPKQMPESFYDIFVNFYIMAMGRCVTSYVSGCVNGNDSTLGRLASLVGYDSNCYNEIRGDNLDTPNALIGSYCIESSLGNTSDYITPPVTYFKRKVPMIYHHFSSPMIRDGADYVIDIYLHIKQKQQRQLGKNSTVLLKGEKKIPKWMEEYLAWHRATKSQLTRSNWNSTDYLILGCFEAFDSCGGISDRLKPLPMIVWEAYQSQRILLIWWERPKPLEEWLIPPNHDDGGIDWTVPFFLREEILRTQPDILSRKNPYLANKWDQGTTLRRGAVGKKAIVYRIQSADAGERLFFDEQTVHANLLSGNDRLSSSNSPIVGSSYQDVFHHLFRKFFTPTPRLAKLLNSRMKQHNLVPGQYTAAHLRAMYGERKHRDPQETLELAVLGANCASNLVPGAPIFFASDTSFAVASAQAYGELHGLPIVSLDEHDIEKNSNGNPIHLEKDPGWKNRPASAYDSTFVDLYMIAHSRCVAYSNGGYGTFGSLLSYDSECKMRFYKKDGQTLMTCNWMDEKMERLILELPKVTNVVAGGRGMNVSIER